MTLAQLIDFATDKDNFTALTGYLDFAQRYLAFVSDGLQAVIVSQNENHYRFFQYREDGHFNITRPINADLFYTAQDGTFRNDFEHTLRNVRDLPSDDAGRTTLIRSIYTVQQCVGATLDALPPGMANRSRKLNGDLFEQLIRILVQHVGVDCRTGTVQVPVEVDGEVQFQMRYQHDLLIYADDELKVIGSVKTSSKDRIDKIFMDKFLYGKLTDTDLPHIAIFLNDVQRKRFQQENRYGVSATFLPGHFKGFTIKLNPLDGVYYCDIRPNMREEPMLAAHIKTVDHFFCTDLWHLVG